jgi:hypothetical protein
MLTEEQIDELKDWVNDLEIDVCELPSCHYDSNPYRLEYPLSCGSGQYVWDEDEEYEAKTEKAIDNLTADGWDAYFDCNEGQDPDELTKEAIEYLRAK